jgi:hypothetical protein
LICLHSFSDEAPDKGGTIFDPAGLGFKPCQHFWRDEDGDALHGLHVPGMCLAWYSQAMLGATGLSKMQWAVLDGVRTKPSPGLMGACPGCGGEVRAKCGKQVTWHWAHVVAECDSWSEGESEWHLKWKYRFPEEIQEVSMGPHRADVKGDAAVLEVQASQMDVDTLAEREEFYGEMLWMLKGEDFQERFEITYAGARLYRFVWKTPRKCWGFSRRRILIDFSFGVFEVLEFDRLTSTPFTGVGRFISPAEIYESICGLDIEPAGEAAEWRSATEKALAGRLRFENVLDLISEVTVAWENLNKKYNLRRYLEKFLRQQNILSVPNWLDGVDESMLKNFQIRVWKDLQRYESESAKWESVVQDLCLFCENEEEEHRRRRRKVDAERELLLATVRELHEERERQRSAMALQRQRELDEAARISAKARRDVETAHKLKTEKEERLRAAKKLSLELLEQSKPLALEWQRGSLVDQIQSIRPRPATAYGSWSTGDLQGLLASLNAARERLGQAKWSQLAGVR